jgi:hypothetical protein
MSYSGAKGTMTPDKRLQRTAPPQPERSAERWQCQARLLRAELGSLGPARAVYRCSILAESWK